MVRPVLQTNPELKLEFHVLYFEFKGRPMRIRIIDDKPEQTEEYPKSNGTNNNTRNNRGRGTGNRGQFRGRQQKVNVTAEDLDKDLDLWRMETE